MFLLSGKSFAVATVLYAVLAFGSPLAEQPIDTDTRYVFRSLTLSSFHPWVFARMPAKPLLARTRHSQSAGTA
jgi:hypothetical protein